MERSSFSTYHKSLEIVLGHIIHDFMRSMKQHGLSMPQVHALMYIYHGGECHLSDIGALADVSKAAASQLTERLVQQGLVERWEDPANRRTKMLGLSEKGKAMIRDSIPFDRFLKELMASLNGDQRETVQAAFSILTQKVGRIHLADRRKDGNYARDTRA